MNLSDEQLAKATREFLNSDFYMQVFKPWADDAKRELIEATDKLIREDAPKNKFAVVSGKRQMLQDVEEQLTVWSRRDAVKK